jgi:hypothetical protein
MGRILFKAVEAVVNIVDKKERKIERNKSLYFRIMEVQRKDRGYKREASTDPSYWACQYFRVIQKMYPIGMVMGED